MEEPTHITAERIVRELTGAAMNSNSSTQIHVNAGGVGIWICATACLVMLVGFLLMLALFVEHSRKIDDLHDYLAAIYVQAPQLKPKESTE